MSNRNDPSSKFGRLFSPRGIAIVGATEDASRPGGEALNALRNYGYTGFIYPVNPKHQQLAGLRCYSSLAQIEGIIDVAVIAVPAVGAAAVINECGEQDIPFAVVLSSGFRETGANGLKLQNEMIAHARAHGVRIIGPNCVGIVNFHAQMFAAFGILTRRPLHAAGPVSMVMQSGGFGNGLAFSCRAAGIGFRLILASGNEADVTAPELIDALVDDAATEVILVYLEGVGDGRALMAAGERALAAGKPLLVWKAGNTSQGARMAATHTANMTGKYDIWRAALRQSGIVEVTEFEEAADYIRVLLTKRLPLGRNVAVLSPSGGSAVVFADAADRYGLMMPKPNAQMAALLAEALPNTTSVDNPIDLGAGGILSKKNQTLRAIKALLADEDIHQLCLMTPVVVGDRAVAQAAMMAEAARGTHKPILVYSSAPRDAAQEASDMYDRAHITVLSSPTRAARAARMLADYAEIRSIHQTRKRGVGDTSRSSSTLPAGIAMPEGPGALDEVRSKGVVSLCGIRVSRDVVLQPDNQTAFDEINLTFPVAVKVLSRDITHKSDAGGVMLDVKDRKALRNAAAMIVENVRRMHPSAKIEGVIVSEMVTDGVEVILGVVNDSVFGPVVLLGMGGIFAEALHDRTYRVAPFDMAEAETMIRDLKVRRILDGMRGRPACDIDALTTSLVQLSELAWKERDRIAELDINPLMVRPQGLGVVAVDALVVLR